MTYTIPRMHFIGRVHYEHCVHSLGKMLEAISSLAVILLLQAVFYHWKSMLSRCDLFLVRNSTTSETKTPKWGRECPCEECFVLFEEGRSTCHLDHCVRKTPIFDPDLEVKKQVSLIWVMPCLLVETYMEEGSLCSMPACSHLASKSIPSWH